MRQSNGPSFVCSFRFKLSWLLPFSFCSPPPFIWLVGAIIFKGPPAVFSFSFFRTFRIVTPFELQIDFSLRTMTALSL